MAYYTQKRDVSPKNRNFCYAAACVVVCAVCRHICLLRIVPGACRNNPMHSGLLVILTLVAV